MPPKTSHSEKYPTSKTLSVKCYQVLVLHIKTICRFADLRGNREAGAGGKDDAATIGKPEKNEGAVFQKTGGCAAETDAGQATRKNGEKGEADDRKTKKNTVRSFKKRGGARRRRTTHGTIGKTGKKTGRKIETEEKCGSGLPTKN